MLAYYIKHTRPVEEGRTPYWTNAAPREVAMAAMAGGRHDRKPGGYMAILKRAEWNAETHGESHIDGAHYSRISILRVKDR